MADVSGTDGEGLDDLADGSVDGSRGRPIAIEGITKRFEVGPGDSVTALEDVSVDVAAGEFVCIVGPSGCGKTTLFRIVAGLEQATSGTVRIAGEPVTGPDVDRGMVFQEYGLFPWRTVRGNVAFGLEQGDVPAPLRRERTREMIDLVGLSGFEDAYPAQLSGGMKQRVGIARALAVDPATLLMDEPFGSVDAQTRGMLQDELVEIWEETGKTVLFVTHDVREAVALGDRVVVLSGTPGTVREVVDVDLDRPRSRTDVAVAERVECVLDLITA